MASARKRPRTEAEDNRAECPFSIRMMDSKDKDQKKKKRRRTDGIDDEDESHMRSHVQLSPFAPSGKFKTYDTMDVHFQVEPGKKWTDMTRYNSFVLNGVKYFSEGFIYVANDSSIERQKAVSNHEPMQPRRKSDDDWVARILEIRASDEHHVYARVYWMYWPDELPAGTLDGKKHVQGRQPYHGLNELIASNHMDIINVVSVTSAAQVKQWYEENEEEIQHALYWRQAFDVRTHELSSVETVCSCNTPENPDKLLIGCNAEHCKKWLHQQCIVEEAQKATYKRLGPDKPHLPPENIKEENEAKRLLSPSESAPVVAASSIDVKGENDEATDAVHVKDNVEVTAEDEDAPAPPRTHSAEPKPDAVAPSLAVKVDANKSTPAKKPGRPKKKPEQNGDSRPWDGMFEVTVKMDVTPPMLEFRDLREGIVGGEKTWTEPIKCLVCGSQIN